MSFDPQILESWLACPQCGAGLVRDGESLVCVGPDSRRRYAILDGIPNMLIEEAEELPIAVWREIMQRHGRIGDAAPSVELSVPAEPDNSCH